MRCLGVDEISLRKGHQQLALVLSDLERHCVIAVLPERSQKAVDEFRRHFQQGSAKLISHYLPLADDSVHADAESEHHGRKRQRLRIERDALRGKVTVNRRAQHAE